MMQRGFAWLTFHVSGAVHGCGKVNGGNVYEGRPALEFLFPNLGNVVSHRLSIFVGEWVLPMVKSTPTSLLDG